MLHRYLETSLAHPVGVLQYIWCGVWQHFEVFRAYQVAIDSRKPLTRSIDERALRIVPIQEQNGCLWSTDWTIRYNIASC